MSATASELTTHSPEVTQSVERPIRRTALAGLALCIIAFWMLQHPYEGIVHDSVLYAFSALARLHPESLGHDLFLTVGSQDRYTLFSPIAAAMIRFVGLEPAASLVTLIAQIAFFSCGWLLARCLMPTRLAVLSAALLVMLPPQYGAKHIFSYAETFMTPRVAASALVLAALAAVLRGRYAITGLCLMGSALVHPLMAAAGLVMLFVLYVGIPRPRPAVGVAVGAFVALVAVSWALPFGPVARFSNGWFNLLYSRGLYLFPTLWPRQDWGHASVPLAALAVCAFTATQPLIRSISVAALVTGLSGLGLALIGSDLLHIVLIAQLQPWRWLWLATALAVILTPVIAENAWRAGNPTRAAAVLVAAAWVGVDESFAPMIACLAIIAAATARQVTDPGRGRLMLFGACTALALSTLVLVGFVLNVMRQASSIRPDPVLFDSDYLLALRHWKPWISGGIVPACLFSLLWWLGTHFKNRASALAVLGLGAILCAAFAPFAVNAWSRVDFPDRIHAQFAPWRQQIAPTAEVLWFDSPLPAWYLLERPSYWSTQQMAASVFSEEMTRRLAQRELVLLNQQVTSSPRQDLVGICKNNPQLGFFVTFADMGPTPFPQIDIDSYTSAGRFRLYRCADYRG